MSQHKFHISKKGKPELCRATIKSCPLGEEVHFDSFKEAREKSQSIMVNKNGILKSSKASKKTKNNKQKEKKFKTEPYKPSSPDRPTMFIYRGFPASGKSTAAREHISSHPETIEINRDNSRVLLGIQGRFGNQEQEEMVTNINNTILKDAMKNDKDIIISDTNLRARNVKHFAKNAMKSDYNIEIVDFKDVSLDELIKRNENREDPIPEKSIRDMWEKFPYKSWGDKDDLLLSAKEKLDEEMKIHYQPYKNDKNNPPAVLVDIDGTVAHHEGVRSPYDFTKVIEDKPDDTVIAMVKSLKKQGKKVIIMSGRSDECKEDTVKWLEKYGIEFDDIHMRSKGDQRADWVIKDELVREHIQDNYYVDYCLDDRNQVVDHHRAMGYKVLQVEPGDF